MYIGGVIEHGIKAMMLMEHFKKLMREFVGNVPQNKKTQVNYNSIYFG